MNLLFCKYNNEVLRFNPPKNNKKIIPKKYNDIAFQSNLAKFGEKGRYIVYNNIDEITERIDKILGGGYFAQTLEKAGVNDSAVSSIKYGFDKEGKSLYVKSSILSDILECLSDIIPGIFLDIPYHFGKFLARAKKFTFLSNAGEKIQNCAPIAKRAQQLETRKNIEIVKNILKSYTKNNIYKKADFKIADEIFRKNAAKNIQNKTKGYATKNERTLNRIATSLVSAWFSAKDFYNISLLQKDDPKSAKKAEKDRYKQEITRMWTNAIFIYLSLGIFSKYAKDTKSNALIIAGSTLFSEVYSRLVHKIPLHPLTPKEAEKIAEKKKAEQKAFDKKSEDKSKINFKSSPKSTDEAFSSFKNKDGSFNSLNTLKKEVQKTKPKKKFGFLKKVGVASLITSGIFLITKGKDVGQLIIKNTPENKITDAIIEANAKPNFINKFINSYISPIYKGIGSFFSRITKKTETVENDEVIKLIEKFKATKEGSELQEILDEFIKQAQLQKQFNISYNIPVTSSIKSGFSKMFNTVYHILSLPGQILYGGMKKIDKIISGEKSGSLKNDTSAIQELYKILKNNEGDSKKTYEQIKNKIVNFSQVGETGELAHTSRAMVTAIASYFFVNDYRNKVLIESGGKDVEKANQEKNERIMHKLSNFVINGTLMNLFNSLGNKILNSSLLGATAIAALTELTNESLVRISICQPLKRMKSKQDIIDFENKQMNKKGLLGLYTRTFKKITGKKSLTQKIEDDSKKEKTNETKKTV